MTARQLKRNIKSLMHRKPRMVGIRLAFPYFPCPNMLAGVDRIQNFRSMRFFAHRAQVHHVSLNGIWRWPATGYRSMLGPPIDERLIPLDLWQGILARGGLSLLSISQWPPSTVVSEARVLLSRGQCSHANEGQSWTMHFMPTKAKLGKRYP